MGNTENTGRQPAYGDAQVMMVGDGVAVLTENADGDMYLLKAGLLHDVLEDLKDGRTFTPADSAKVYFASYNGEPVNPHKYTDFGSLVVYLKKRLWR